MHLICGTYPADSEKAEDTGSGECYLVLLLLVCTGAYQVRYDTRGDRLYPAARTHVCRSEKFPCIIRKSQILAVLSLYGSVLSVSRCHTEVGLVTLFRSTVAITRARRSERGEKGGLSLIHI